MSNNVNRKEFDEHCEQAKAKYKDFEEKIKKVEQKVLGSISTTYDLNKDSMFEKFINENLDSGQMYDYIRAEYLNLIIARKQFVKEGKESLKKKRTEKKEAKAAKQIEEEAPASQPEAPKPVEELKIPPQAEKIAAPKESDIKPAALAPRDPSP